MSGDMMNKPPIPLRQLQDMFQTLTAAEWQTILTRANGGSPVDALASYLAKKHGLKTMGGRNDLPSDDGRFTYTVTELAAAIVANGDHLNLPE